MATHNIGKIFVELDLDPSRYMRSQKTLLKEAQSGATVLEKNFKNLGLKSSATFDLMRAQAIQSFNAIKKSGKATTDDLIRAEKAKAERIKQLNEQQYGHTTSMFENIKKHWMGVTAAIVAGWYAINKVMNIFKNIVITMAARYETLGIVMRVVGNTAGYTGKEMLEFQKNLQKTGISAIEARQSLTRMNQAQLELSQSSKLARVAQDAAVIGAMNSSEAFNQMVYGIQSANVRVLRTIGINVSFEDSYKKVAAQLGRTTTSFSETEKANIRMNAVLEAGKTIAGTYEAAMETAGKQLLSLKRYFDDLKVVIGDLFTPALSEVIEQITISIKGINSGLSGENTKKIHDWGVGFRITLISIEAEIMRLSMLIDKMGGSLTWAPMLLYGPGSALGIKDQEKRFEKWAQMNLDLEARYKATEQELIKLAEKQLALEESLTAKGKARIKAKLDAIEKERIAAVKAAKIVQAIEATKAKEGKEYIEQVERNIKAVDTLWKKEVDRANEIGTLTNMEQKGQEELWQTTLDLMNQVNAAYETFRQASEAVGIDYKFNFDETASDLETVKLLTEGWANDLAAIAKLQAEIDEALGDTSKNTVLIEETYKNMLSGVQGVFADTFEDIFSGQLDSFEDFTESMKSMFIRVLAEMAAKAATTQLMASLGGLGGFGMVGAGIVGLSLIKGALSNREDRERQNQLSQSLEKMNAEIEVMLDSTEGVAREFSNINKQFDEYISTAGSLRGSLDQLLTIEEKRIEVLEFTRKKLLEDFIEPLEDKIASLTLSDMKYDLYQLDDWYNSQIENAKLLGEEAVKLLEEAYRLAKEELILKERERLLGLTGDIEEATKNIGLTNFQIQLRILDDWFDKMSDSVQDISGAIADLQGNIISTEDKIAELSDAYEVAMGRYTSAQTAYEDATSKFLETYVEGQVARSGEVYRTLWEEEGRRAIEIMKAGGKGFGGFYLYEDAIAAFQAAYQELQSAGAVDFGALLAEIEGLENSVISWEEALAQLEQELGELDDETTGLAAAYLMQLNALRAEFTEGLEEIIRSHTMSDYEQQMYDLNEWYEEMATNAEALGLSLDLLNEAYELQKDAIEETALAIKEDWINAQKDIIGAWQNTIKSIRDQINEMMITSANPEDARTRMEVLGRQIESYTGGLSTEAYIAGLGTAEEQQAALSELQGMWGDYLSMAQDIYQRPSLEYQAIYDEVLAQLSAMENIAIAYQTESEILLDQLSVLTDIRDILNYVAGNIPGYQHGTDYLPSTGLYTLPEGEKVIPAGKDYPELSLTININESKTPRETGREVRREVEGLLRSDIGRKLIQHTAAGR